MSHTRAALSACFSALTSRASCCSCSPMESSFLLSSSSRLATKLLLESSLLDPSFLFRFDFNDDFLLEEELRRLES